MPYQLIAGTLRAVQVVPFGEVITRLVPSLLTATYNPLPKATDCQAFASAAVRPVQVIPSGEVATLFVPPLLATKSPSP